MDTGLEVVEQFITMAGGPEENTITNGIKTTHTTANTIRIEGDKKSIVGALVEVSDLSHLLNIPGLKVTETV